MRTLRPLIAAHPSRFGRRLLDYPAAPQAAVAAVSDDLRLFATAYAAGFLFVSALIF